MTSHNTFARVGSFCLELWFANTCAPMIYPTTDAGSYLVRVVRDTQKRDPRFQRA
jgi:hypothetical protein